MALGDKIGWTGVAQWKHFDAARRLLDEGEDTNALTLQGANSILSVYFNSGTQMASNAWYMALLLATPDTSAVGPGVGSYEQTGSGYARINIPAWTLYQFGGLWRVATPVLTFSASGAWPTTTAVGFVDSSSGPATTFLSSVPLTSSRTLASGDFLQVIYAIQLS